MSSNTPAALLFSHFVFTNTNCSSDLSPTNWLKGAKIGEKRHFAAASCGQFAPILVTLN
jgi:hypothetical protein